MFHSKKLFVLKRELDFGDLVTSLSILISGAALLISWQNDSRLRTKEYADRIRRSTSVVTAKVERWGELSERFYQDIQPAIIDVSEKVAETHDVQPANRMLYRGYMDAESKSSQRIVDEQLQVSYMELYGYAPELQPVFDKTIAEIKDVEAGSHDELIGTLQQMLRDPKFLALSGSPEIGNQMRFKITDSKKELNAKIQQTTRPLRSKMLRLIQLTDDQLADATKRSAEIKRIISEAQ